MSPIRPIHPHRPVRLRGSTAALGAFALVLTSLVGLGLTATPASASVTGVTGSAYGLYATAVAGAASVGPTPTVSAPPSGTATNSLATVPSNLLVDTGVLSVSSTTTGVPGASGSVTSTATVANVNLLAGTLGSSDVSSSCTSGASGSSGQSTVVGLTVGGGSVTLPSPIPANYMLPLPVDLLGAIASVELNEQVPSTTAGSTSITVDAISIQLLNALGGLGATVTIASSSCGATGPDVDAAPVVTQVSPDTGPAAGGTPVTITGTDLTGTTAVDFGSTPATDVSVVSPTEVTADSPAGTGTVDVTVTTGTGTSTADPTADGFTYVASTGPTVTGLDPDSGPAAGGTPVTITGTDLTGTSAVDFGSTPATDVSVVSPTEVTADSPAGTDGATVPVTVITTAGTTPAGAASDFTYGTGPAVDGVSPASGPLAGDNTVTVSGANLTGATAVDFGSTPATDISCTATSCTATAPAGTGTVDVTVMTPTGTSPVTSADAYTYTSGPTVASISPLSGPTAGGTTVTITGSGLAGTTGVDFGSTPATSFTCTATTCTAVTPPGTAGTVAVTVIGPAGTASATATATFTFVAPYPYTAVAPYRIADTRTGSGEPYAGQPLGAGASLAVQVTGTGKGTDSVPADATVAVLNVTEAGATEQGYFTVYPTGDTRPGTSAVNFVAGQPTPDLVEVPIGSGGKVSVYNHAGTAQLVVDVEGYVAPPATAASTAGRYNPLSPTRIVDTRAGSGEPYTGDTLSGGSTLDVQVTGRGGVPSTGVSAVVLNVTEADATAAGYFTVYPDGVSRPLASNVNFTPKHDTATRVIVPVGSDGKVSVYNYTGRADLVVDVSGWFTDAAASSGDIYSGVLPARIADTRPGSGEPLAGRTLGASHDGDASATIDLPVAGVGGVPAMSSTSAPTSVVLDVTAVGGTVPSYLTVYPTGEARPDSSDVNWVTGETRSNLVVVKVGSDGDVSLTNFNGTVNAVVDVVGYYTASTS